MRRRIGPARIAVGLLALAAIAVALWDLRSGVAPLSMEPFEVGETPGTVYRLDGAEPGPLVVVTHGFAGSRQLMEPFSVTLARNGYTVVAFDFEGHGRNPVPMGDVADLEGVQDDLIEETTRVAEAARERLGAAEGTAYLGHSMATAVIVPAAVGDPRVDATVAVSMSTDAITPTEPPNLLVIVGALEKFPRGRGLTDEALDAVRLATGGEAQEGETVEIAPGNLRRAVFADGVEHVGVLYSAESMAEALAWLDRVFGREGSGYTEVRGPSILLLLAGIVAMGWPLAALLPRLVERPAGARPDGWRRFLGRAAIPAIATPLLLWPLDTGFLPVLVADYLAVHFLVYGLITGLVLWRDGAFRAGPGAALGPLVLAVIGTVAWTTGALGWALDAWVASFWPHAGRLTVIAALFAGTLAYLLSDEWLTRGEGTPRAAPALSKLFMLASLVLAILLNPSDLFFLAIITPVVVLFFLLYGLFAGWVWRATGHPAVGGIANAVAFAWALGVTFPLIGS